MDGFGAPYCPRCLVALVIVYRVRRPYLLCAKCGLIKLTTARG